MLVGIYLGKRPYPTKIPHKANYPKGKQIMSRIIRILVGILVVLLGVYLFFRWLAEPAEDYPYFAGDAVQVIAHQGGEQVRPSNTMAAFDHAAELGVDVLEMDVHGTADGVLVVIHDDTVDRTTDGMGKVNEMTFAEIQQLDAGYYWTDDDGATYPYRGQGITIPALEEVLQAHGDLPMVIEIKQEEPSIVEPFCAMLQQYEMTDHVLVASFHHETLVEFREACPGVATSMSQKEITPLWVLSNLGLEEFYTPAGQAVQVPLKSTLPVLGEVDVVTERFINNAHKRNVHVDVWTINDPGEMVRLIDIGVDGIITDRPDLLLEVLGR